ncbi:hypothetical protein TN53_31970 [Streptomyces sp. WM6386]|nr:hypothetical protein TN53_31970 [Streptomyces sp. WM6386]
MWWSGLGVPRKRPALEPAPGYRVPAPVPSAAGAVGPAALAGSQVEGNVAMQHLDRSQHAEPHRPRIT